jgi:sterol desaturase/sphingolipid hydroxylase (fatty acid hydroxylase superfamily)
MQHHLELYPPTDLVSDSYRSAHWLNSGVFLFTPPFIVIVLLAAIFLYALNLSFTYFFAFAGTALAYSILADYVHDTFHLRDHYLHRFKFYDRIRSLHMLHHIDMRSNFGIVTFFWDKVFHTFKV